MTGTVLHVLGVLALLAVVAFVLTYGIKAMMHDGWTRLAWAAVRVSEAAPKAAEAIARLGDHVAAWAAVRSAADAPASARPRRSQPPPEFAPVPRPEGDDPARAVADEPSAAEVTRYDVPLIPDRERPYMELRRPFRRTAMAVATAVSETREALAFGWPELRPDPQREEAKR